MVGEAFAATGRRKEASASVRLIPDGKGTITINNRKFEDYLPRLVLQYSVVRPLELVGLRDTFDIKCSVKGGGLGGQADAIQLGIARALLKYDSELQATLKEKGLLTRNPREKERKKYGLAGARKRYQFSKR
ncbi:MAG: 30S ribosomal protein S9 [Candidatus Latescibacteria bacterium]|jgi:small subunit ribosomal protein S9|nr:30S ribosomal protein S9 [Candidatus Latescibacterota bacterium]